MLKTALIMPKNAEYAENACGNASCSKPFFNAFLKSFIGDGKIAKILITHVSDVNLVDPPEYDQVIKIKL